MQRGDETGDHVEGLVTALLGLDRVGARRILMASQADASPMERVETLIVPALERIGNGWEDGGVSLSQVYMSGRMCEELVDSILPPDDQSRTDLPPMAIAVLEDYHMLGLRIVYSVLRASGYALQNYGRCALEELVTKVKEDKIGILLISVLMLPSALRVRVLRERLEQEGCKTRLIVGGAPFRFDSQLWREVRADAVGQTAQDAVTAVREQEEALR
jgi:methanogenic corrinoid protein MtbC1